MAFVLRNCLVWLDGTDISTAMDSVAVDMSAADVDVTAMGAGGRQHLAGIRDDKFTFNAFVGFGAATLDSLVSSKFSSAGTLKVVVWPNVGGAYGSTTGTANPAYLGFCPLLTYSPVSGKVGDPAMTALDLPVSGTITTLTSGTP